MMADPGTAEHAVPPATLRPPPHRPGRTRPDRRVGAGRDHRTPSPTTRTDGTPMSDPTTTSTTSTVISAKPVVLSAPDRGEDLQVRVSAPATGGDLPVIVFSHGFGWSMNGYAPLA